MSEAAIASYFNEKAIAFGPTHKAVGWSSRQRQWKRYHEIGSVISDYGGSLLDVGCGVGDFFHYLKQSCLNYTYRGIDIAKEMIRLAQHAYPGAQFDVAHLPSATYVSDVVVACGVFNLHQGRDHEAYLKAQIQQLVDHTRECCVVSLLSERAPKKEDCFYYVPLSFVEELTPLGWKLTIRDEYLDNDVLLIFRK